MLARRRTSRLLINALVFVSLVVPAVAGAAPQARDVADPAFEHVWEHCDKPVAEQVVARGWMWGHAPFATLYEPYAEAPGGRHLVSYYDKSRMEINDPAATRDSEWFVTNGLLVADMIAGRIQTGEHMFAAAPPADVPLAGDTLTSVKAPTYASLARVASVKVDRRYPDRSGEPIAARLDRHGAVGAAPDLAALARYGVYEPTLGHNIAAVFWDFMTARGKTYHDGHYLDDDLLFSWVYALGYPISEPYWIEINVGGQDRMVLIQAFQRRLLTYTPTNPAGWQVEMANVGRAYYNWRYGRQSASPLPPSATATPARVATATATTTPVPATMTPSVAISPTEGLAGSVVAISGQGFPPRRSILITVAALASGYRQQLATIVTDWGGAFHATVTLPDEVGRFDEVVIGAAAEVVQAGAVQSFKVNPVAGLTLPHAEAVTGGSLRVAGAGFPARRGVTLGMISGSGPVEWMLQLTTGSAGSFDAQMPVGSRAVGSSFRVVALTTGGLRLESRQVVTIIAQPALDLLPGSGPAGASVSLRGSNWPANRVVAIGIHSREGEQLTWLSGTPSTDAAGGFATTVLIERQYVADDRAYLVAYEPLSGARVEVVYRIGAAPTPTPAPGKAQVAVEPSVLVAGERAVALGQAWPRGAVVSLILSSGSAEELLGTAQADAAGDFAYDFTVGERWREAGLIYLQAQEAAGGRARASLWMVQGRGRVSPGGLPLSVQLCRAANGTTTIKLSGSGWPSQTAVDISVVAADNSVNQPVAGTATKDNSAFQATFAANAPWWGRADLGVRARTAGGQESLRYLPWSEISRVAGGQAIRGYNWPAHARIELLLHLAGEDVTLLGATSVDNSGSFSIDFPIPRPLRSGQNYIELRVDDEPYSARFEL